MSSVVARSPLSKAEAARYKLCTETILQSLQSQFDGGIALIEVRDAKLYRQEFDTFEEYCAEVLKISRGQAYRLIEAATVKESLPPKLSEKITNERQARALADVPPEDRAAVIKAAEKSGDITGESISQAISQMSPMGDTNGPIESGKSNKSINAKPPIELDEIGYQIPAECVPVWSRRGELVMLMGLVSKVKCSIEQAKSEDDPLFLGIRNTILAELTGVHYQLSSKKPYAVCTQCQGHPNVNPAPCRLCYGTGLIGKEAYESVTAKEVREMRERKLKRR